MSSRGSESLLPKLETWKRVFQRLQGCFFLMKKKKMQQLQTWVRDSAELNRDISAPAHRLPLTTPTRAPTFTGAQHWVTKRGRKINSPHLIWSRFTVTTCWTMRKVNEPGFELRTLALPKEKVAIIDFIFLWIERRANISLQNSSTLHPALKPAFEKRRLRKPSEDGWHVRESPFIYQLRSRLPPCWLSWAECTD